LEVALNNLGVHFQRAKVGDRYVMEVMLSSGSKLGGESSGHIICLDRTTTGDGIISALQVIYAIIKSGSSLHDLKSGMRKFPQKLVNVKINGKININDSKVIQNAIQDAELQLGQRGRVLLRPSGTEPLVRVMVEGEDEKEVELVVSALAQVVEKECVSY
jgi:phosphoglucosamine mutase